MRATIIAIAVALATSAHAGEIISIHDIPVPKVMPKPTDSTYDPFEIPPYSDEAALDDVWVRTWLLMDIDAHGKVVRFKFLNHPGYGLEPIAVKEAFKVKFSPALDNRDKPTETFALWRIEWPAYDYMREIYGASRRLPRPMFDGDPSPLMRVHCVLDGPLNLSSRHPIYRDCRKPDMSKVDVEAWVYPDGHREDDAHSHTKFVQQ